MNAMSFRNFCTSHILFFVMFWVCVCVRAYVILVTWTKRHRARLVCFSLCLSSQALCWSTYTHNCPCVSTHTHAQKNTHFHCHSVGCTFQHPWISQTSSLTLLASHLWLYLWACWWLQWDFVQISAAELEELLVEKQRERGAIVPLCVFVSEMTTGWIAEEPDCE